MKAGLSALKTVFGFPLVSNSYRGLPHSNGGAWNFNVPLSFVKGDVGDVYFTYNGSGAPIQAYDECPLISTIINKQSMCFVNGKTQFKKESGKEAGGEYVNRIKALIKNPNAYLNWKEFEAKLAIYVRLYGWCIILPVKPVGFDNSYATALYIIPPFMCEIDYGETMFYKKDFKLMKSVKVTYGQEVGYLKPDDIILIKDVTISRHNIHLPESPICSIQENINNLIGIYKSKGMLIKYRGSLGILTPEIDPNGNVAFDSTEKDEIQSDLMRYGLQPGQWKYVISSQPMRWQSMQVPYRDLMLTEWGQDEVMTIADKLDYPYKLLANNNSTAFNGNDINEFKKQLYVDFILPFSEMIYEQLSEWFSASDYNVIWVKDYSHLAVLQDDKNKLASAKLTLNQAKKIEFDNGLISINQWLKSIGEPEIENGDIRIGDIKKPNTPLATLIGPGGVQSVIAIIANPSLSEESKINTLNILFGIPTVDAASMVIKPIQDEPTGTETAETAETAD